MNLNLEGKTKVFACPWVGEFGWEIFAWHAVLRKIKKDNPQITEMVCATRPGREFLYEDFSKVIHYDPKCQPDMWCCRNRISGVQKDVAQLVNEYKNDDFHILPVRNYENQFNKMEFIKFGSSSESKKYDVLIHARNRAVRPKDNWSECRWKEFLSHNLGNVAAIGSKEGAISLSGADDLRGIPLKELADYCSSSSVVVGPSSGPMHFATLCGCPQVAWSPRASTCARYKKGWNPFETQAIALQVQNPSVTQILNEL